MSASHVSDELGIGPGHSVLVLNAPAGFPDRLEPLPAGAEIDEAGHGGEFDVVLLFASGAADLERLAPRTIAAVRAGGRLWIAYPKEGSGVPTDLAGGAGWETMAAAGMEPAAEVALDQVWTALRFRLREPAGR